MTCQPEIGGQTDICLMNPDGSALQRLTDTAVSERSPAFSPDGQRIAWSVNPTFDIWVMNVDGSEPQRIFQPSFVQLGDSPTWAPTGDRIAFTCGGGEICVVRSDGTGLASLVSTGNQVDSLDWSPDGSTIVFACGSRLCTVQSDGTNLVELPGQVGDREPAWSPDGSLIASAGQVTLFKQGLLVMDADGTNRRALYSGGTGLFSGGGGVSDPVWSPDGSQIAATCTPPGGGAFALCFIDLNGGGLTTVSQGDEAWWGYDWAVDGGAAAGASRSQRQPQPDPAPGRQSRWLDGSHPRGGRDGLDGRSVRRHFHV